MKAPIRPGLGWISEQFRKAEEQLISGQGDIRSRMRSAVPYVYGVDPGSIPDLKLRRKFISFQIQLEHNYPSYKEAINARKFATLSKQAIELWNLGGEIRALSVMKLGDAD